jgi:hypothetical protein
MHLSLLEDYISKLLLETIDDPRGTIETSEVCSTLWEILIMEERLIPDFVIDGDKKSLDKIKEINTIQSLHKEVGDMKKLVWLMATAFIGVVAFLFGFFTAP